MDPVVIIIVVILAAVLLMLYRRKKAAQPKDGPAEPPLPTPTPTPKNVRQRTEFADDETPVPGAITLTAMSGPLQGRQFPIPPRLFRIGAEGDNDLVISGDDFVSSNHAHIEHIGGVFRLHDDQSRNGTRVNGERLAAAPAVLKAGDVIKVGRSEFQVVAAGTGGLR